MISGHHVLTAALCIEDKSPHSIQVIFGALEADDDDRVTRANVRSWFTMNKVEMLNIHN